MENTDKTENTVATILAGCVGIPGEGPYMAIVMKVQNDCVSQARFSTYGCPVSVSCGQFVCDQVEGNSLAYAATIDEAAIIVAIGQMPLGRDHCPGLAAGALRDALSKSDIATSH